MKSMLWENQLRRTTTPNSENSVSTMQNSKTEGNSSLTVIPENSFVQQVENASKTLPVNLVISPLSTGNNFALINSNGVQLGVRIRF